LAEKGELAKKRPRIALWSLIAATYFMVSGGPYGLEELVTQAGYLTSIALLFVTPVLWSLPTALLVGELSAALPDEGGYYVWVRRALGPFWGFQEAWLSLAASVFDMAIYPTLFVAYLGRLQPCFQHLWPGLPTLSEGFVGWSIGVAVIVACALSNIGGVRAVGRSSFVMVILLLGPFIVLSVVGLGATPAASNPKTQPMKADLVGALMVAMWNYMGWDNASTIAGEVERPERTYPLAMLGTVCLVMVSYLLPVAAVAHTGTELSAWSAETGAWVDVAIEVVGPALGAAIGIGGMISGFGTCNSLVLSYSRIPVVMAEDGYLPATLRRLHPKTGAPWVSVIVCATAWAMALGLGFRRLVALDIILYGLSLVLEFVALAALRIAEPRLPRPFRVPGGLAGALVIGIAPTALLVAAFVHELDKVTALILGGLLVAAGPALYWIARLYRRHAID
jgi:amino acid transporter